MVVTRGKRKRIVTFKNELSLSDNSVLIKRIREEFQDCVEDDRCEIVLQMKNAEVNDFIEVKDSDVIQDKAVLEFFTEPTKVRVIDHIQSSSCSTCCIDICHMHP